MIRVVSPHLDDAVLSLGMFMSTIPCEVITVCAGTPADVQLSDYDAARGFKSTRQAMGYRRSEDAAAVDALRGKVMQLEYLDGQYVDWREAAEHRQLTVHLRSLILPKQHFMAPLGLGHPDHRWVAKCARDAVLEGSLLVYEELPYRVTNPEEVWVQLEQCRTEGFEVDELTWPFPFPLGDPLHVEAKKRAIAFYRSQFPQGAVDPCLLVPERVWRITR